MADWLTLNGLTAADCRTVLSGVDPVAAEPAVDPAYPTNSLIDTVLAALTDTLPQMMPFLTRIGTDIRIDLSPDRQRFPRAFTLHDDGRGLPFISCPSKGRLSDVLLLGHEIGHALQILASGKPVLPPIQRETAAYLAEEMVCNGMGRTDPTVAKQLTALHHARTGRIIGRTGAALRDALKGPDLPYSYDWNYPVARMLAQRAVRELPSNKLPRVFDGTISLNALIGLPNR